MQQPLIELGRYLKQSGYYFTTITPDSHQRVFTKRLEQTRSNTEVICSDLFSSVPKDIDTVIANPPLMLDPLKRGYRHGGDSFGLDLSELIVREFLDRLDGKRQLLLYTATCFVEGEDRLMVGLQPLLQSSNLQFTYEEINPDIYGMELSTPAYADVECIAAVGLQVTTA